MFGKENKSRAGFWLTHGGSFILGGVVAFGACELNANGAITHAIGDKFGTNGDSSGVSIVPLGSVQLEQIRMETLPLREQPLNGEILKDVAQNVVSVNVTIKPGYESYRFPSSSCSGFVVRDVKNERLVITAGHCLPKKIRSGADGKEYDAVVNDKGESVLNVNIVDANGKVHSVDRWTSLESVGDDPVAYDVAVIRIVNPSLLTAAGLPLNLSPVIKWETYYQVSRVQNGELKIATLRFLDSTLQNGLNFIDLGSTAYSCVPGTSGSVIVNRLGEVVSVINHVRTYHVTREVTERFNLDPVHFGREILMCSGSSSSTIKKLM